MFGPKIKVDKDMYARLERVAEIAGYSSVDEFVKHVLEREMNRIDPGGDQDPGERREFRPVAWRLDSARGYWKRSRCPPRVPRGCFDTDGDG